MPCDGVAAAAACWRYRWWHGGGGGQQEGHRLLPGLVFHVSKTKERPATTSTVKLKKTACKKLQKSVEKNASKHTGRQGKRGVAWGIGNFKINFGPTFLSLKKCIWFDSFNWKWI